MARIAAALVLLFMVLSASAANAGAHSRGQTLQIRRFDNGATTERLTFITHAPDDYNRVFIVDKAGIIYIKNLKSGVFQTTPFLDISAIVNDLGNERGLLGLAFHPNYQSNGFFYVNFTDAIGDTVVRRYSRDGSNPGAATTAGSIVVLTIAQPHDNHNGGWLGFSPVDNYLYIAMGDGGFFCDETERAQNIDLLLGKILRIDVNSDDFPGDAMKNYSVPKGNPFVDPKGPGADEIWAVGLRNPWRCGFDRLTGDLWIGDVGQDAQEEVNVIPAGEGGLNFGWDCREGTGPSTAPNSFCKQFDCSDQANFTEPIVTYPHQNPPAPFVCAVTGGYVYRGCAVPGEYGNYFFVDYCRGIFYSYDGVTVTDRSSEWTPDVGTIVTVTSFGEDAWGELYFGEDNSGEVFRMEPVVPRRYADVNCDTIVNVTDLFQLLSAWGDCLGCKADLDGDDEIDVTDLFMLLADWG